MGIGSDLLVRLPGREMTGRFEALDERGRLLLRRPMARWRRFPPATCISERHERPFWRARRRGNGVMAARNELVFAPLGGVGEIGMNLSIYGLGDERRRSWLIVDLGVSFAAEEHLPGIDLILPDIRYLVEERRNIVGLVLTHAHEDHFGALLDLWPRLKVPIYATPFTAALLEAKRQGEPGAPEIPVNAVPLGPFYTGAFRHRARRCRPFDPGIERAHHPHPGGRRAAHRRLEDRPDAGARPADRRGQSSPRSATKACWR